MTSVQNPSPVSSVLSALSKVVEDVRHPHAMRVRNAVAQWAVNGTSQGEVVSVQRVDRKIFLNVEYTERLQEALRELLQAQFREVDVKIELRAPSGDAFEAQQADAFEATMKREGAKLPVREMALALMAEFGDNSFLIIAESQDAAGAPTLVVQPQYPAFFDAMAKRVEAQTGIPVTAMMLVPSLGV